MKKRSNLHILGLLFVLVVALAGCGGGGGGGNDNDDMATFKMPGVYYDYLNINSGYGASIPSGKSIKFYTLASTSGTTVNADHTFTGTTGSSSLKFTLPNDLIGQNRYIYAVVILSGSFDLQGKNKTEIQTAIESGQILFGKASISVPSMEDRSVSLTKGGTVGDFTFIGKIGNSSPLINFTMPSIYYTSQDYKTSAPMPSNKTVKFYTLTDANVTTFNADHTFSGTTGSSTIQCELPSNLIGKERYIYAVVILKGSFELQGNTQEALENAYNNKDILFGKATESEFAHVFDVYPYTLSNGSTIGNFIFIGKP
jgi:hypothetical protein